MPFFVKLDLKITSNAQGFISNLQKEFSSFHDELGDIDYALVKAEERALVTPFFSSDHDLQTDFCAVTRQNVPTALLDCLKNALAPMNLRVILVQQNERYFPLNTLVLVEGERSSNTQMIISFDDPKIEFLTSSFRSLGLENFETKISLNPNSQLTYEGDVSSATRRRLIWALRLLQLPLPPMTLNPSLNPDPSQEALIRLHLASQDRGASKELSEMPVLHIRGDDVSTLQDVAQALSTEGIVISYDLISEDIFEEELPWFELNFGLLSYHQQRCYALGQSVIKILDQLGFDQLKAPLHHRYEAEWLDWEGSVEDFEVLIARERPTLSLPFQRALKGLLYEANPQQARHWQVRVYSDDSVRARALINLLKAQGYLNPILIDERGVLSKTALSASISYPEHYPQVLLEELSSVCSKAFGISEKKSLHAGVVTRAYQAPHTRLISISLHFQDLNLSAYLQRLKTWSTHYDLVLKGESIQACESLWQTLNQLELNTLEFKEDDVGDGSKPLLIFGGAQKGFVEYLQAIVERELNQPCILEQRWGEEDMELWIQLPQSSAQTAIKRHGFGGEQLDWFPVQATSCVDQALLSRNEQELTIADLVLPLCVLQEAQDRARVPRLIDFKGYCLDQLTSETLYHVAEAVVLGEPCLLEGPTSASKTSVILYLAALLGQPVARLNLSAQTDTGELIGRFAPVDGGWCWVDGLVIQALSRGWWLILDELNLAEPQVLERLNSLLERHPSLTVSEHDGRLIGADGEAIHERFRIFATMNPSEYVGRAPLSPAYRDRWLADRIVPKPHERSFYEMIVLQLWGEVPKVNLFGRTYEGFVQGLTHLNPPLQALAQRNLPHSFSIRLARFHDALDQALHIQSVGLHLKEKSSHVLSRRSLLATLQYLQTALIRASYTEDEFQNLLKRALWRYYVARLKSTELRTLAHSLWLSTGLSQLNVEA